MSQLRAVGAQGELDLPRITVIGNQSAGKSSVVEAISGIKVPRDAGTCTRCPMECRLSSSTNSWSCRISIRLEFDASGRPRQEILEHRFGNMITSKDEVEIGLRRAQFAVLNPSVSFEEILVMSAEDMKNGIAGLNPLPFSRNVVCVDLEGPELTDLMFLDLPGIIANAEQEIVDLVEDMVVSHIRGNCLILVALPMTDDIENQRALRLARQEDPAGRRTIGVLTKPDMLSVGSKVRDLWLDVIEGRNHILMHGYFCTRQPDDDERGKNITPAQARRAESTFFAETIPWSTTKHKDRFGTENLVSSLSTILVQIINDRLPLIRSMANERMEACRRELGSLPAKIVGEPATHMLNLITAFCSEMRIYVDGQSDMSDLIHERNTAFAEFKHSINKTQPQFIARTVGQIDGKARESATDLIASQTPVSITRELPGNIPFSAKKTLITAFQQTWLACAVDCFNAVKQSMLALLMRCIDEKFGRYELLQTRLKTCITDLAAKYFESCGNFLMAMLEVEQMPFTQNDQYLQTSTEKWLSRYKDELAEKRENNGEKAAKLSEKVNNALALLAELGYSGITSEDFGKLRQVDEFETEITVMSEVRGYFEVRRSLGTRVIDNIPALIDTKFLRAIAQNLQQELISEFGLGSENANAVCAAFLVEDPRLVAKREDLMARNRRLEAVQIQLHNFGLNRTAAGQV
ncbi:P-loop containing nucleoside triphosphate hydrolase protein [Mycena galopus ATCC 62051]|nr:P-loop containing nucleoside triphosphate hydrolase protein [Mycena galopus ATCC 62051]